MRYLWLAHFFLIFQLVHSQYNNDNINDNDDNANISNNNNANDVAVTDDERSLKRLELIDLERDRDRQRNKIPFFIPPTPQPPLSALPNHYDNANFKQIKYRPRIPIEQLLSTRPIIFPDSLNRKYRKYEDEVYYLNKNYDNLYRPLPDNTINLRRPPPQVPDIRQNVDESNALLSADILVAPFTENSGERNRYYNNYNNYPTDVRYDTPYQRPTNYRLIDAQQSPLRITKYKQQQLQRQQQAQGGIQYVTTPYPEEQPQQSISYRPSAVQYDSGYRQPLRQSNQFTYAPQRPENTRKLLQSSIPIPYPPSFISITTSRPEQLNAINTIDETVPIAGNGIPIPYDYPLTRIPDPFLNPNRPSKSLLDSYIPSWEIAKLLENQRYNDANNYYRRRTRYKKRDISKSKHFGNAKRITNVNNEK